MPNQRGRAVARLEIVPRKRVLLLKSDFSFVRSIKCRTQVWGVAVDPGDNIHVGTTECVEVFDFKGGEDH